MNNLPQSIDGVMIVECTPAALWLALNHERLTVRLAARRELERRGYAA